LEPGLPARHPPTALWHRKGVTLDWRGHDDESSFSRCAVEVGGSGALDTGAVWRVAELPGEGDHGYPNIGIDSRNQFDLWRDMPRGWAGVRQVVAVFHRRGVHVLFPIMFLDHSTRDEGAGPGNIPVTRNRLVPSLGTAPAAAVMHFRVESRL